MPELLHVFDFDLVSALWVFSTLPRNLQLHPKPYNISAITFFYSISFTSISEKSFFLFRKQPLLTDRTYMYSFGRHIYSERFRNVQVDDSGVKLYVECYWEEEYDSPALRGWVSIKCDPCHLGCFFLIHGHFRIIIIPELFLLNSGIVNWIILDITSLSKAFQSNLHDYIQK